MKTRPLLPQPNLYKRTNFPGWLALAGVVLSLFTAASLSAATLSWSGGSATTGNWSDTANWGFSGPPASGDTLIFPALQPRLSNTNNISSLVLAQIRFAGAGGGYDIRGNAFTLTNSIAATNTAGANTINNAITLSTADVTVNVGSGVSLTLAGILQGSVGVIKSGAGTLTYACSGSNPYAGTTRVNAGTLQLNVSGVSAFGGPLVIGDGSGTAATVRHLQSAEILDSTAVTIYNGGTLDLNNFIDTIGPSLTLNGGIAQSGSGTLTLSANNTITVNSNSTITGNLNIGSGTCAIVANATLTVSAAISGAASITKSGIYDVLLTSANTYSGLTVVQNGILWIRNSLGLGSTASGTVVSNGASLVMSGGIGVTNESLTLNGPGVNSVWGALDAEDVGTNIWAGPITLNADSTIAPYGASTHLRIIGSISGAGGVEKFANSSGTLWFEGNTANTYAGLTKIIAGTNILAKVGVSDGTIPHDLQIGDATHAAAVLYQVQNQIPNTSIVTLNDFCLLDFNGYVEGLGGLVMYGATVTNSAGGRLDMYPPGTIAAYTSTNDLARIYGTLGLTTPTTISTIDVTFPFSFNPALDIIATINNSQSLTIAATNDAGVELHGSNSFTGPVIVSSGVLMLGNDYALGSTSSGTVVSNGATLLLFNTADIGNESLTLYGTGAASNYGTLYAQNGTSSWAGPVTFATDVVIRVEPTNSTQLTISGPISGPGGFTKIGPGILSLTGTAANTYLGASVVNAGTLLLGKTPSGGAIPGTLAIGTNCTVRDLLDWQINSASKPVTILDSGLFDLAGHNEWIGPLTLQGAQIATGSGLLYLGGDILVNGSSVAMSQITGNATLWNGTKTINCGDSIYSPDFQISAHLGGNLASGIIKTGPGEMSLTSSNSYPGLTTVSEGSLTIENSFALGLTNAGTVVSNGAILSLLFGIHVGLEPLTVSGPGAHTIFGALNSSYGSNSWDGAITLGSNTTFSAIAPTDFLNLAGPIGGTGDVTQIGPGTLIFSGSTNNTYGGTTRVNGGTLTLAKSAGTVAVPGALDISGTVKLAAGIQTAYTSDVTIQDSGRFETDGYIDYIDSLNGSGQLDLTSGGWLFIGWNGGSSLFSGVISGSGDLYCDGAVTLTGTNTYTGTTHIYHGTLLVNGYQPLSPVDFYTFTDGNLGGTGVVGPISVTGHLRPGTSPGCLTSSNLTFTSTGNYHVELNGTTPCSGYDQMIVHGTNNLANAVLNVNPAFTTPVSIGQQFTIINNDGADAITGTFAGLPNGATFNAGGFGFKINYNGGTGNDVVLTLLNQPGSSVTVNAAAYGWYDDTGYCSPGGGNYLVGESTGGTNRYRDWFVFNVPEFNGTIAKAELLINCYSNRSPEGRETYVLHHVSTPVGTLTAGGSGLASIYNDLADGAVYGVRDLAVLESYERAIVPLNATFIGDATAAAGGQIALGGALATLDPTDRNEMAFGWSGPAASDVQLRLTFGTSVLINATTNGWYDNTGYHVAANGNYLVGELGGKIYRDFFVFDLPGMSARPMGAELLVKPYAIGSPTNWVTCQLHDVTTPIGTLVNNASGATDIFADLADGDAYGGRELYLTESNLTVNSSVPLNGAFTAAAFANQGGQIALGGALTLDPTPDNEFAFKYSSGTPGDVQLWLGFIPAAVPAPFFLTGSPTALGGNVYQFVLSGTTGTTNEIQASMDFENWDVARTLYMTNTTTTFFHTNSAFPYRYFRARLLQ
jgi:fibronectin-binding autotransporter adhesin